MDIKIIDKFDPICEILGLIYLSHNYDKIIQMSIEALNKEGINGELFVKKNLKVMDKYIKTFNKYKDINDDEIFFFEEDDIEVYLMLAFVIIDNKRLIDSIDEFTNDELRALILDLYNELNEETIPRNSLRNLNDIIEYLKTVDISENSKWKLTIILDNPKKFYRNLIKVIENNQEAYNEAYKSVEKKVDKLITNLIRYINSEEDNVIKNTINKTKESNIVLPTLAFGASLFELKGTYFVGVLYEITYKESINAMGNKGELIVKLKALSDKSKLEIVTLLKTGPKYSLEIAESLNLTAATVSYHMGSLLECGMVSIEKKQGKVYYNLNEEGLKSFMIELNSALF